MDQIIAKFDSAVKAATSRETNYIAVVQDALGDLDRYLAGNPQMRYRGRIYDTIEGTTEDIKSGGTRILSFLNIISADLHWQNA